MDRLVKRKKENPQANAKNYEEEEKKIGVDLVLDVMSKSKDRKLPDENMIGFTQDKGEIKKAKEAKYLTVQGLLDHPYFIGINEADISIVIDEFEKLL
jgi:hypothetical protein